MTDAIAVNKNAPNPCATLARLTRLRQVTLEIRESRTEKTKQQRAIADWRQGRTIVHNASRRDSDRQHDWPGMTPLNTQLARRQTDAYTQSLRRDIEPQ